MGKTSSQALSGNGCLSVQAQRHQPASDPDIHAILTGKTLEWLHGQESTAQAVWGGTV